MEFIVRYKAVSGKENQKTFRNQDHVLDFIEHYQIDSVQVKSEWDEIDGESILTPENFVKFIEIMGS